LANTENLTHLAKLANTEKDAAIRAFERGQPLANTETYLANTEPYLKQNGY
jgi:hypothetical protein